MEVIFVLIILSLIVAVGFLFAFFWAVRSGQFDDSYTPSIRVLFDDGTKRKKKSEKNLTENKNHGIQILLNHNPILQQGGRNPGMPRVTKIDYI